MNRPLVVAITGASGAVYAHRLLEVLIQLGRDVQLTISPSAQLVFQQEMQLSFDVNRFALDDLKLNPHLSPPPWESPPPRPGSVTYYHHTDFLSPIASGSALTDGMVICPCSGSTLSAVATAASGNLIQRAADVHLKERRRLVLVPRETPLALTQLENMQKALLAGAVILPAAPGWYHGVRSPLDLVDFIVARILDQLGIPHRLIKRWGSDKA